MSSDTQMERLKLLDPLQIGPRAKALQNSLHGRVIGQPQAMQPIMEIYQMHLAGLSNPTSTAGNILMLGPTGTGKTRTVEIVAQALVGTPQAVIKIDCGEFQHSHEIAKLIGSPPGYLGHRETRPRLSQERLDEHHTPKCKLSFLLFDEIEKASDALWNIMLGILDKATLVLGDNRQVDFSRAMVFCTSNIGAEPMLLRAEAASAVIKKGLTLDREQLYQDIFRVAFEAAKKKFPPEFLNRFNRVTGYAPLFETELLQIVNLELEAVQEERINVSFGKDVLTFEVSQAVKLWLVEHGTDVRMGARELKRTIERVIVVPMSNLIESEQLRLGMRFYIDVGKATDLEMPFAFGVEEQAWYAAVAGGGSLSPRNMDGNTLRDDGDPYRRERKPNLR